VCSELVHQITAEAGIEEPNDGHVNVLDKANVNLCDIASEIKPF